MTVKRKGSTLRCRLVFNNQFGSDIKLPPSSIKVVRMRLEDSEGAEGPQKGRRIVGTLIPTTAVDQLVKMLGSGAEENEEIIH